MIRKMLQTREQIFGNLLRDNPQLLFPKQLSGDFHLKTCYLKICSNSYPTLRRFWQKTIFILETN